MALLHFSYVWNDRNLLLRSGHQEPYYKGTIITWGKAVKDAKMQLNDAFIESWTADFI